MEATTPSMVNEETFIIYIFPNLVEKIYELVMSENELVNQWILPKLVNPRPVPPWKKLYAWPHMRKCCDPQGVTGTK